MQMYFYKNIKWSDNWLKYYVMARSYLPELRHMPTEYIFEPWKAPEAVHSSAGCIVNKDYLLPMVVHIQQRQVCVQRMKELTHELYDGHTWQTRDVRLLC